MIKIKKLLTSLAAIGLVASTSSMVVSCGPSFSSLRNRTIDNTVYKTTFSNNIQNWNMAATMQSADFKILANTQDTLMTYNKGDDLLNPSPLLLSSAATNDDGKTWELTIRPDAKWYDFKTGEVDSTESDITAKDILNTAKYTLDPHNGSELMSDWITFIDGAKELNKKMSDGKKITDEEWTNWKGLQIDKNDPKKLTLTLTSPATYFNTVLTTGSFSPMPDRALTMGYSYGRGSSYDQTLLSGPFYVSKFKNSNELILKRNKNYKDKNAGTIKTIKYLFSRSGDVANTRRLWETGDITEAVVSPSDKYGYEHYVGDKFDGIQKVDNNLIGSKYLWFNFSRQHKKDDIRQDDKDSNEALSLDSVRTLIAYAMNRATLVEYFAGTSDKNVINDFITNTFNPSGYLKINGEDYTKSVVKEDGNKAYYQNKDLLNSIDGVNTFDQLIKKVNDDLHGKKVTLTFLTSGVNAKTFNPYIKKMINEFNDIKDNPIRIIEQTTADDAAYQLAQQDGNYSMFITGETPTYIDPMSFLVNLQSTGPMSLYNGTSRLFNNDGSVNKNALSKFNVSPKLTDEIKNFTDELNSDNADTNSDRYAKFAATEKKILFEDKTIIPLYKPNGKYTYNLSYLNYDTKPNHGFGYQDYKFDKVTLFKSLQDYINQKTEKQDSKNKAALTKQD